MAEYNDGHFIGFFYTCSARVSNDGNQIRVTSVSQNHLSGRQNSDVGGLWFDGLQMINLPKDIEIFFQNLRVYRVLNSAITTIQKDDFPFPTLMRIDIINCPVQTLQSDLFQHLPNLEVLFLRNNRLMNVGPNLLNSLSRLRSAHFGSNPCINHIVLNSAAGIPALRRELALRCPPTEEMTCQFCNFCQV